jgi:hypothetical protein
MITDDQIYVRYQPLFDHLSKEHGLTLLRSEMDEIILKAQEVVGNYNQSIKTTWSIKKFFQELRNDPAHHLGMGDIRLTVGMQEEIVNLVNQTTK